MTADNILCIQYGQWILVLSITRLSAVPDNSYNYKAPRAGSDADVS